MARLNEPSESAESIESLKRRFIRQNRELARNNSTQSIRIRSLEGDVSRLLVENAELRKTIITLEHDLEGGQSREVSNIVEGLQEKLEGQIQALGGLASELGLLKRKSKRRHSDATASRQSLTHRCGRNGPTLSEIVAGQEDALPTIVEGKPFPRKTMESKELDTLLSEQSQESPDLGPPPLSFFDREQSEGHAAGSATQIEQPISWESNEDVAGLLSANFETRKRRRDTRLLNAIMQPDSDSSSPAKPDPRSPNNQSKQLMRAGVKRKAEIVQQRFKATSDANGNEAKSIASPTRQVLGSKPVNIDPVVSPRKLQNTPGKPRKEGTFGQKPQTKTSNQRKVNESKPSWGILHIPPAENFQIETAERAAKTKKSEPKTPGMLDLFSPVSSQPSDVRPELRDTPPPTDLGSIRSSMETSTAVGRTSKRARANVSYAEPNLISKMRRPTKELIDAVTNDRRSSSDVTRSQTEIMVEHNVTSRSEGKEVEDGDLATIKRGLTSLNLQPTNSEDHSPLSNKNDGATARPSGRSITLGGRRTTLIRSDETAAAKPSASSEALSSLISAGCRAKVTMSDQKNETSNDESNPFSISNIRDSNVTMSSRVIDLSTISGMKKNKSSASQRRASVGVSGLESRRREESGGESDYANPKNRSDTRHRPPLGNRSSLLEGGGSEKGLRQAQSTIGLSGSDESKARGERIAARRRSMVL